MNIPKPIYKVAVSCVQNSPSQESCGLILSDQNEKLTRVIACENLQDQLHQEDPFIHPRTSQTAYFIDPKRLFEVHKEMRYKQEQIAIIYHSHINADAYFSEEDYRMAVFKDEPLYPRVKYLIFSIRGGLVREKILYGWNSKNRKFEEEGIKII